MKEEQVLGRSPCKKGILFLRGDLKSQLFFIYSTFNSNGLWSNGTFESATLEK